MAIARLRSATINENLEIPPTAVFVANWHEADEIGKMVEGNLARRTPKLAHVPKVIVGPMGGDPQVRSGNFGLKWVTGCLDECQPATDGLPSATDELEPEA